MKVILISGKAQNGKDTCAKILKNKLECAGSSVLITHFGDLVKYICKEFFGWDGEKDVKGRELLQYVGTDIVRSKYPDYWVDFIVGILEMFDGNWDYVLIPDTRFPNEIAKLKEYGIPMEHGRVVRMDFNSPLTQDQQRHISETALDHVLPDFYINNYGTLDELEQTISRITEERFNESTRSAG